MEETLLSDHDPGERRMAVFLWLVASVLIWWNVVSSIRKGDVAWIFLSILSWAVVTLMIWYASREPLRVTLVDDVLRVRHRGRVRDIPLWRVHSVELDFPQRRRHIILLVEPEPGAGPSFDSLEFVPRGAGFGFGGQNVADDLRRRVAEARAAHSTRAL
jgi:hypothetical protein